MKINLKSTISSRMKLKKKINKKKIGRWNFKKKTRKIKFNLTGQSWNLSTQFFIWLQFKIN